MEWLLIPILGLPLTALLVVLMGTTGHPKFIVKHIDRWCGYEEPTEPPQWTPTLAEIHKQQHEQWEQEYEDLLPPDQRKPKNIREKLEREHMEFLKAVDPHMYERVRRIQNGR